MDRLKRFQVSSAQNETLNWAFGIYLLVVILGFVDNWLGRRPSRLNRSCKYLLPRKTNV
uniref:hypothetical protein n=1 Tax=Prevotella micans TaxID=189723 RepID=UPI001EE2A2C7|nr:hypothetical protein [Prevotella micans]